MRSRIAASAATVLAAIGVGTAVEVTTAPAAQAAADYVINDGGNGSPVYFTDLVGTKRILYPGWSNIGHYGIYQASRVSAPTTSCVKFTVYHSGGGSNSYYINAGGSIPVRDGDSVHALPGNVYCGY
jgi:hypothetical protein